MKKTLFKKKKSLFLVFSVLILFITMIITNRNHSFMFLGDKNRDFTYPQISRPMIFNMQVSDPILEIGNPQTISCSAFEPSGIQWVKAYIQEPDSTIIDEIILNLISGFSYEASWDSYGFSSGKTYYVDFEALDNNNEFTYENNGAQFDIIDTTDPDISNPLVSDPLLELTDAQTITCEIFDYSGISDAKVFIQFPDTNTIATREMINIGGNTYQAIWSSFDASINDYFVDILAIDDSENLNSEYQNNIITFSIIEKPHQDVKSVSAFRTITPSLIDQLKSDDSNTFNIQKELYHNYEFNGKPVIAFPAVFKSYNPAYSWSEQTDFNEMTLDWWNQYPDDGMIRKFYYDGFIWTRWNTVDDYITVKSQQRSDCTLREIDFHLRLAYRCDGSYGCMNFFIHNFATGKEESILFDNTHWTNYKYYDYYLSSADLDDPNLHHYLNENGQIKLTLSYHCTSRIYWVWRICRIWAQVDVLRVTTTWEPNNAKTDFGFDPGLINGVNDFYINFQGKTNQGTATITINDDPIASFSTSEITLGISQPFIIRNVNKLTIEMGTALEIQIDFLYLQLIRDYPYEDVKSVSTIDGNNPILENQLKDDDGIIFTVSKSDYDMSSYVLEENFNYYWEGSADFISEGNIEEGTAVKDDDIIYVVDISSSSRIVFYQEFSFNLGSGWKDNYYLQELTIWYRVCCGAYFDSQEDAGSQLEIFNYDTNQWDLWEDAPLVAANLYLGLGYWNDDNSTLTNTENTDYFNMVYVSNEGILKFRFMQYSYREDDGGWIINWWDYFRIDFTYYNINPAEIEFTFKPGVLNGMDDYYLWFQAQTNGGIAGFYVNGIKQFDIEPHYELTVGPIFIFILEKPITIKILLEDARYIDIDYFFVQLKQTP